MSKHRKLAGKHRTAARHSWAPSARARHTARHTSPAADYVVGIALGLALSALVIAGTLGVVL